MSQDLYQTILSIPPGERPPHYYDLLGMELFESDATVIHRAGLDRMRKLREWQMHPDRAIADQVHDMLDEIGRACTTLEVGERKAGYDAELAEKLSIDLAADEDYEVLSVASELKSCPNCGAEMSDLALLCVECGYHFETGKVLATDMEPDVPAVPPPQAPGALRRGGAAPMERGRFAVALMAIISYILTFCVKATIVLIVIAVMGLVGYYVVKSRYIDKPPPKYELAGEYESYERIAAEHIENSPKWKEYFKTREQRLYKPPFVKIKVEYEKGPRNSMDATPPHYAELKVLEVHSKRYLTICRMKVHGAWEFKQKASDALDADLARYMSKFVK